MIELERIGFGYAEAAPLFEDVNLTLRAGEITHLHGRSGCGKSTFLRLLSGFLVPSAGRLLLEGHPYERLPYPRLRSRVVYLHQTPVMESGKDVLAQLLAPYSFRVHGDRERPGRDALERKLQALHLEPAVLDRDATTLSVGEQHRVALLRASLLRPDFLLLDEPLANLDETSSCAIRDWLTGEGLGGAGLVVASHQPLPDMAGRRVLTLAFREGRLHAGSD